jgi:transcriptional regulator with XRE-family HTH domain
MQLGHAVRNGRTARGWTQARLADVAEVSRPMVTRVEQAHVNATIEIAGRLLDALEVDVRLVCSFPLASGSPLQRDGAHATCSAYVQRRLEGAGWLIAREVEIVHGRSHGWIDLLAFDPRSGTLVVIEIKTEIDDVGRIERTLAWYQREAWSVARRLGWRPSRVAAWLLVLATDHSDDQIRSNRDVLAAAFPGRAPDLLVDLPVRALALIDPRSRRRQWLVRSRVDGRRSPAPYLDYADFMRSTRSGSRSHRRRLRVVTKTR